MTAHNSTGYEVFWSARPSDPYLQVARWNGPLNSFTILGSTRAGVGMNDGDTLRATIVGGTVTAYINGVQKVQVTDPHPFSSGSPGIGFYLENSRRNPAPQAEYGFSSFRATDDLTESTISVRPSSESWALSNAWMHGFLIERNGYGVLGRPTRTKHIGSLGGDFGVGRNAANAPLLQADSELTPYLIVTDVVERFG